VRREVKVAFTNGVATWVRARFEMLALCSHWHDYTLGIGMTTP